MSIHEVNRPEASPPSNRLRTYRVLLGLSILCNLFFGVAFLRGECIVHGDRGPQPRPPPRPVCYVTQSYYGDTCVYRTDADGDPKGVALFCARAPGEAFALMNEHQFTRCQ